MNLLVILISANKKVFLNTDNIISKLYKSACTSKGGFVSKESDIYSLNRIGINEEMITDRRGNFSQNVFTLSMFLEPIRK